MRSQFPGYYRRTDEELSRIWQDGIFVLDTNVLLNLYRYSTETRGELLGVLRGVRDRLWIPHQVADEFLQKVRSYVDLGESEGATVALDGREPPLDEGFFFGPTILDNVTGDMRVAREEIFGPVLSVVRVESLDEAIEFTNGSSFGNACSIYTENGAAVRYWRENVQAGMLGVNIGVAAPMAFFPFNGVKSSFYGDLHATGKDGVRFFTENKVEVTRWLSEPGTTEAVKMPTEAGA